MWISCTITREKVAPNFIENLICDNDIIFLIIVWGPHAQKSQWNYNRNLLL